MRWVPGEVQRVVVVARPEAVLLAEAKEDYTRNLAAISHLRRQHAQAARDKCRLGGADGARPWPPGAAQATQAPGCAAHFGPRPKAPIPRRRSCGFQPAGARHALPGAGASPRPGGGRRGARLAPRTRRLPSRARGGGRGGGAHVGPDARASDDAAHRASRGGGLLSAAQSSSTRDSEGSAMPDGVAAAPQGASGTRVRREGHSPTHRRRVARRHGRERALEGADQNRYFAMSR